MRSAFHSTSSLLRTSRSFFSFPVTKTTLLIAPLFGLAAMMGDRSARPLAPSVSRPSSPARKAMRADSISDT